MSRLSVAAAATALALALVACGHSSSPPPPTSASSEAAPITPVAAPDGPGKVLDASFESKALGVVKKYKVYLPAGYDALTARRYPVVYMLHGLGGNETNWVGGGKLDAVADGLHLQAIVVMPDGDDAFYANAATSPDLKACLAAGTPPFSDDERPEDFCVAKRSYEDYIARDLVAHVDATYRTIALRRARGIGGLSMGGFGALQLAMRHKDLFAATASHSGVHSLFYEGPHPYEAGKVKLHEDLATWGRGLGMIGEHIRGVFGAELANWRAHDPTTLAQQLENGELAIYLDCGTEDIFQFHDSGQYLHDLLTARGITHEWYLGPGKHDFSFWGERIDDSLAFFTRSLAPAAP
ncbi:MAG TPA: alpha/beta hydrolase family protein [Kofleriaceae bacterium]|nr:alpha/beta hydrolase family protein [Kofleriaceae bacterium]